MHTEFSALSRNDLIAPNHMRSSTQEAPSDEDGICWESCTFAFGGSTSDVGTCTQDPAKPANHYGCRLDRTTSWFKNDSGVYASIYHGLCEQMTPSIADGTACYDSAAGGASAGKCNPQQDCVAFTSTPAAADYKCRTLCDSAHTCTTGTCVPFGQDMSGTVALPYDPTNMTGVCKP